MPSSPGAVLVQLGPLSIRWYGLLMASAIAIGFWLAYREAQAEDLPADDILTVAQWAVLVGLVGARIYEVIFNWDYYGQHLWKIPAVWEGGLAIHGGLIAGTLIGLWVAHRERLPIRRSLDVVAPSIAIGQAIGRWGNFFNEEAFGIPTDLPWKLYISPRNRPLQYAGSEYFHPTFLYESLWDVLVFVLLISVRRRLAGRPGVVFYLYIGLYSVGRFLIEAIRVDSFWVGSFRVPQLASLCGIALALIGLFFSRSEERAPA